MKDTRIVKSGPETPATDGEQAVALPEAGPTLLPEIDVIENANTVRLVADLPGVEPQSIEVTVEGKDLVIQGQGCVAEPSGYSLVRQEYTVGNYRRDFTISAAVDPEGIKARCVHGVLEVTLPKREEAKARTIRVDS